MTTTTGMELVHPQTGELVDLKALATDTLALDLTAELQALADRVDQAQRAVIDELARRVDKGGARTAEIELADGRQLTLETNAPTEVVYPFDQTRDALQRLVAEDELEAMALARVLKYPRPKPQDPRVDRRAIGALEKIPAVEQALAEVRFKQDKKRTIKIDVQDPSA